MQSNSLLDVLSSRAEGHLQTCLQFIEQETMSGSLSIYNGNDYQEFLSMSVNVEDNSGTGSKPFPGELLGPKKECVTLSKDLCALLVDYYNNAYNYNFIFLTDILEHPDTIATLPGITIYRRIKIGDEIFGSTYSKKHTKSAKILAKFVLDDNTTDIYPGLIQYYFENIINLLEGPKKHVLAYVQWYQAVNDKKTRYYCQVDNICNVELWNWVSMI